MIAVDTSALMAVVLDEPEAEACKLVLQEELRLIASAGTLCEALIVSMGRNVGGEMIALVEQLGIEIVPVTSAAARRVSEAYRRWGRGFHPASLNFGDCFAYEVAEAHGCPLLFVGDDFRKTDIRAASQR